jgi:hypothetical protein
MRSKAKPKRPAPDCYDHLWSLLPLFLVFCAVIMFAATADDRPMQTSYVALFEPLAAMPAEPSRGPSRGPEADRADASVPSAAAVIERLPREVAEPVATY